MRGEDMKQKAFSRIVKKVPDWRIRSYEIKRALEAYDKIKEQLIAELGEVGFEQFDAQVTHELALEFTEKAKLEAKERRQTSSGEMRWTA
jgi:hypothetical protein